MNQLLLKEALGNLHTSYHYRRLWFFDMSPNLCSVCRSIPPKIWCHSYNLKENSREIVVQLQTLGGMEEAKTKGCQLCKVLLDSPQFRQNQSALEYKLPGRKEMMYLRRSLGFPDRAVELGVGHKGSQTFSRTFFYRMPAEWCTCPWPQNPAGLQIPSQSANVLTLLRSHGSRGQMSSCHIHERSSTQAYVHKRYRQQYRADDELAACL